MTNSSSMFPLSHWPAAAAGLLLSLSGCAAPAPAERTGMPVLDDFCLEAQQLVVNTTHPFQLRRYQDLEGFIRSKAEIAPPTVKQYVWYEDENQTRPVMISCKLKSADHLNLVFGPGTAGPGGHCQDMNRLTVERSSAARRASVQLPVEEPGLNEEEPGMTGPDWLAPFTLSSRDADGTLIVHTKGFRVDFSDPRFADMPAPFRGIHYCHFIAPEYLERLLEGDAAPGLVVGVEVNS